MLKKKMNASDLFLYVFPMGRMLTFFFFLIIVKLVNGLFSFFFRLQQRAHDGCVRLVENAPSSMVPNHTSIFYDVCVGNSSVLYICFRPMNLNTAGYRHMSCSISDKKIIL